MNKLSSVLDYARPGLDPDVWNADSKLLHKHKDLILGNLHDTLRVMGYDDYDDWIKEVKVVGSLTSYQYTSKSDIDCHVFIDWDSFKSSHFDKLTDEEALDEVWAILDYLNKEKPITLEDTKHPVEYFFETGKTKSNFGDGIYNLINDEWEKDPRTLDVDYDVEAVYDSIYTSAEQIMIEMDISIGKIERDMEAIELLEDTIKAWDVEKQAIFKEKVEKKLEDIEVEIKELIGKGKEVIENRQKSYSAFTDNNLIFKFLQKYGYIALVKMLEKVLDDIDPEGDVTEKKLPIIEKVIKGAFAKQSKLTPKEMEQAVDKALEKEKDLEKLYGNPKSIPMTEAQIDKAIEIGYSIETLLRWRNLTPKQIDRILYHLKENKSHNLEGHLIEYQTLSTENMYKLLDLFKEDSWMLKEFIREQKLPDEIINLILDRVLDNTYADVSLENFYMFQKVDPNSKLGKRINEVGEILRKKYASLTPKEMDMAIDKAIEKGTDVFRLLEEGIKLTDDQFNKIIDAIFYRGSFADIEALWYNRNIFIRITKEKQKTLLDMLLDYYEERLSTIDMDNEEEVSNEQVQDIFRIIKEVKDDLRYIKKHASEDELDPKELNIAIEKAVERDPVQFVKIIDSDIVLTSEQIDKIIDRSIKEPRGAYPLIKLLDRKQDLNIKQLNKIREFIYDLSKGARIKEMDDYIKFREQKLTKTAKLTPEELSKAIDKAIEKDPGGLRALIDNIELTPKQIDKVIELGYGFWNLFDNQKQNMNIEQLKKVLNNINAKKWPVLIDEIKSYIKFREQKLTKTAQLKLIPLETMLVQPYECKIFSNKWNAFVLEWIPKILVMLVKELGEFTGDLNPVMNKLPQKDIDRGINGLYINGEKGSVYLNPNMEGKIFNTLGYLMHEIIHANLEAFTVWDTFFDEGYIDYICELITAKAEYWGEYAKEVSEGYIESNKFRQTQSIEDPTRNKIRRWKGQVFARENIGPKILDIVKEKKEKKDYRFDMVKEAKLTQKELSLAIDKAIEKGTELFSLFLSLKDDMSIEQLKRIETKIEGRRSRIVFLYDLRNYIKKREVREQFNKEAKLTDEEMSLAVDKAIEKGEDLISLSVYLSDSMTIEQLQKLKEKTIEKGYTNVELQKYIERKIELKKEASLTQEEMTLAIDKAIEKGEGLLKLLERGWDLLTTEQRVKSLNKISDKIVDALIEEGPYNYPIHEGDQGRYIEDDIGIALNDMFMSELSEGDNDYNTSFFKRYVIKIVKDKMKAKGIIIDKEASLTPSAQEEYNHLIPNAQTLYNYFRENKALSHQEAIDLLSEYAQWNEIPGQEPTPLGSGVPVHQEEKDLFKFADENLTPEELEQAINSAIDKGKNLYQLYSRLGKEFTTNNINNAIDKGKDLERLFENMNRDLTPEQIDKVLNKVKSKQDLGNAIGYIYKWYGNKFTPKQIDTALDGGEYLSALYLAALPNFSPAQITRALKMTEEGGEHILYAKLKLTPAQIDYAIEAGEDLFWLYKYQELNEKQIDRAIEKGQGLAGLNKYQKLNEKQIKKLQELGLENLGVSLCASKTAENEEIGLTDEEFDIAINKAMDKVTGLSGDVALYSIFNKLREKMSIEQLKRLEEKFKDLSDTYGEGEVKNYINYGRKFDKKATTQEDKVEFFKERTNKHIERVIDAAEQIVEAYPEFKEVMKIVEKHDASKFEEPEYSPYLDLTWNKFKGIKDTDARTNAATLHHITNNEHHPEFWNKEEANLDENDRDSSKKCIPVPKMSDLAIVEMVADWQAMSVELEKNTVREWYDKVKDVRWHFDERQSALIDKLIKVFETEKKANLTPAELNIAIDNAIEKDQKLISLMMGSKSVILNPKQVDRLIETASSKNIDPLFLLLSDYDLTLEQESKIIDRLIKVASIIDDLSDVWTYKDIMSREQILRLIKKMKPLLIKDECEESDLFREIITKEKRLKKETEVSNDRLDSNYNNKDSKMDMGSYNIHKKIASIIHAIWIAPGGSIFEYDQHSDIYHYERDVMPDALVDQIEAATTFIDKDESMNEEEKAIDKDSIVLSMVFDLVNYGWVRIAIFDNEAGIQAKDKSTLLEKEELVVPFLKDKVEIFIEFTNGKDAGMGISPDVNITYEDIKEYGFSDALEMNKRSSNERSTILDMGSIKRFSKRHLGTAGDLSSAEEDLTKEELEKAIDQAIENANEGELAKLYKEVTFTPEQIDRTIEKGKSLRRLFQTQMMSLEQLENLVEKMKIKWYPLDTIDMVNRYIKLRKEMDEEIAEGKNKKASEKKNYIVSIKGYGNQRTIAYSKAQALSYVVWRIMAVKDYMAYKEELYGNNDVDKKALLVILNAEGIDNIVKEVEPAEVWENKEAKYKTPSYQYEEVIKEPIGRTLPRLRDNLYTIMNLVWRRTKLDSDDPDKATFAIGDGKREVAMKLNDPKQILKLIESYENKYDSLSKKASLTDKELETAINNAIDKAEDEQSQLGEIYYEFKLTPTQIDKAIDKAIDKGQNLGRLYKGVKLTPEQIDRVMSMPDDADLDDLYRYQKLTPEQVNKAISIGSHIDYLFENQKITSEQIDYAISIGVGLETLWRNKTLTQEQLNSVFNMAMKKGKDLHKFYYKENHDLTPEQIDRAIQRGGHLSTLISQQKENFTKENIDHLIAKGDKYISIINDYFRDRLTEEQKAALQSKGYVPGREITIAEGDKYIATAKSLKTLFRHIRLTPKQIDKAMERGIDLGELYYYQELSDLQIVNAIKNKVRSDVIFSKYPLSEGIIELAIRVGNNLGVLHSCQRAMDDSGITKEQKKRIVALIGYYPLKCPDLRIYGSLDDCSICKIGVGLTEEELQIAVGKAIEKGKDLDKIYKEVELSPENIDKAIIQIMSLHGFGQMIKLIELKEQKNITPEQIKRIDGISARYKTAELNIKEGDSIKFKIDDKQVMEGIIKFIDEEADSVLVETWFEGMPENKMMHDFKYFEFMKLMDEQIIVKAAYEIGDRIRTRTKGETGTIIDFTNADPNINPNDVDMTILWDKPLDGNIEASEVHPTEIEHLITKEAEEGLTPKELEIAVNNAIEKGVNINNLYWRVNKKLTPSNIDKAIEKGKFLDTLLMVGVPITEEQRNRIIEKAMKNVVEEGKELTNIIQSLYTDEKLTPTLYEKILKILPNRALDSLMDWRGTFNIGWPYDKYKEEQERRKSLKKEASIVEDLHNLYKKEMKGEYDTDLMAVVEGQLIDFLNKTVEEIVSAGIDEEFDMPKIEDLQERINKWVPKLQNGVKLKPKERMINIDSVINDWHIHNQMIDSIIIDLASKGKIDSKTQKQWNKIALFLQKRHEQLEKEGKLTDEELKIAIDNAIEKVTDKGFQYGLWNIFCQLKNDLSIDQLEKMLKIFDAHEMYKQWLEVRHYLDNKKFKEGIPLEGKFTPSFFTNSPGGIWPDGFDYHPKYESISPSTWHNPYSTIPGTDEAVPQKVPIDNPDFKFKKKKQKRMFLKRDKVSKLTDKELSISIDNAIQKADEDALKDLYSNLSYKLTSEQIDKAIERGIALHYLRQTQNVSIEQRDRIDAILYPDTFSKGAKLTDKELEESINTAIDKNEGEDLWTLYFNLGHKFTSANIDKAIKKEKELWALYNSVKNKITPEQAKVLGKALSKQSKLTDEELQIAIGKAIDKDDKDLDELYRRMKLSPENVDKAIKLGKYLIYIYERQELTQEQLDKAIKNEENLITLCLYQKLSSEQIDRIIETGKALGTLWYGTMNPITITQKKRIREIIQSEKKASLTPEELEIALDKAIERGDEEDLWKIYRQLWDKLTPKQINKIIDRGVDLYLLYRSVGERFTPENIDYAIAHDSGGDGDDLSSLYGNDDIILSKDQIEKAIKKGEALYTLYKNYRKDMSIEQLKRVIEKLNLGGGRIGMDEYYLWRKNKLKEKKADYPKDTTITPAPIPLPSTFEIGTDPGLYTGNSSNSWEGDESGEESVYQFARAPFKKMLWWLFKRPIKLKEKK